LYENLGLRLENILLWLVSKVKNLGQSGVNLLNYIFLFLLSLSIELLNTLTLLLFSWYFIHLVAVCDCDSIFELLFRFSLFLS